MVDKNKLWLLISKYLNNEISGSEKNNLFEMLESDPLLREEFEAAQKIWKQSAGTEEEYDLHLLQRTHQKITEYDAGQLEAPELPPYAPATAMPVYTLSDSRRTSWKKWIAAAAMFIGISLLSYWFLQRQSPAKAPLQWASIDVSSGEQRKIILPDSSVVHVNAGSHIEYPLSFTDSIREIRLDGEAFFEVTKNARQPFVVNSGSLRTRVLGTSFNVRAYKNEETQTVLVATGKVQVEAGDKPLDILLPNQLLSYHLQQRTFSVADQLYESMDWQQNRMAFNDIAFKDLAAELGRRYGKTLVFTNPAMQNCRFRAIFNNLSLEKILQQLSLTNGFSYTTKGDSIYLKGKSCE